MLSGSALFVLNVNAHMKWDGEVGRCKLDPNIVTRLKASGESSDGLEDATRRAANGGSDTCSDGVGSNGGLLSLFFPSLS